jgi:apolipoprotein N-acyltransferase
MKRLELRAYGTIRRVISERARKIFFTLGVAAGAGVIAAVSVLFPQFWLLGICGIALFAHVLHQIPRSNLREAAVNGLVFGLFYSGVTISWFFAAQPLDWSGATPVKGFIYVTFSWLMVTLVLGFFYTLFSTGFVRWKSHRSSDAILAASLWTLVQYVQMWGFALLTSNGTIAGAHFSPTMVGYSLAGFSPLLQLAAFGGIYMLTFVVVCAGFFLQQQLAPPTRVQLFSIALIGAFLTAAAVFDVSYGIIGTPQNDGKVVRLALVTTNFAAPLPQTDEGKRERAHFTEELLRSYAHENTAPDVIVFSEAAGFFSSSAETPASLAMSLFGQDVAFIDSDAKHHDEGRYVEMNFYDHGILRPETHRKVFLVPQGEYFPWLFLKVLQLIGINAEEQRTMVERMVSAARSPVVGEAAGLRIGALFCSEVLSPSLYRDQTSDGAQVLINTASHAWFHGSPLVDRLALTLSQVRAVENDRYLAIAGNVMPSTVISNRGEIVLRSEKGASVLTATVEVRDTTTPYVRFGDYVLVIPLGLLMLIAYTRREDPLVGEHKNSPDS